MSDEESPDPKTLSGTAQSAFNNPAFVQAVTDTQNRIVEDWRTSDPRDTDLRERCYFKLHALEDVVNYMGQYITTDALETAEQEREQSEQLFENQPMVDADTETEA